ncbi:AbrB/MazE/SpoVT family DNA-binding domain-containing protein [Staphylococcus simulans]|uniref:AbrB/MazE/SpoVT family DNA-binding domain-containing protein n=1 Tax=Staphylococcus simulans TaxID=1286 RepID=UPI0021CFFF97|nr:AbrB/MazE/SpoVT family DNA-binding domain-containing protein [Staphylococcus simulans]UXR45172.1 AbrB/MazE/SpoVT family DNA-binding domain-containing protein [Staphylococcus simulans]
MSEEHARIFKTEQGHAVTLPDTVIESLNLKPGDQLVHEIINDTIVLKKVNHEDFTKEWNRFFQQGGDYLDYKTHEWGEASEREQW